jgi:hypothetical protein
VTHPDTEFAPDELMENHRGTWVRLDVAQKRIADLTAANDQLREQVAANAPHESGASH